MLEYDAARKIAQGLGVHLEQLTTLVEVKGDKACLLPVSDRSNILFGKKKVEVKPKKKTKKDQLTITGMETYVPEETTTNEDIELKRIRVLTVISNQLLVIKE